LLASFGVKHTLVTIRYPLLIVANLLLMYMILFVCILQQDVDFGSCIL